MTSTTEQQLRQELDDCWNLLGVERAETMRLRQRVKELEEGLHFQACLTRDLMPYQERAVKAEKELAELRKAQGEPVAWRDELDGAITDQADVAEVWRERYGHPITELVAQRESLQILPGGGAFPIIPLEADEIERLRTECVAMLNGLASRDEIADQLRQRVKKLEEDLGHAEMAAEAEAREVNRLNAELRKAQGEPVNEHVAAVVFAELKKAGRFITPQDEVLVKDAVRNMKPLYTSAPPIQQGEPVGEVIRVPPHFLGIKFAYPGVCVPGQKLYASAAPTAHAPTFREPDLHTPGIYVVLDADGAPVLETLALTGYSARATFIRARNMCWSKAHEQGFRLVELRPVLA